MDNAARVGAQFIGSLEKLGQQFPKLISNIRGRGLMCAFDLPSGEIRDKAIKAMADNEMLVLSSGPRSVRFRPALNLTMDEAAEGIRRIQKSLEQIA